MIGGKRQWIHKLKTVTDAYNSTVHNTTGMRPIDVTRSNAALLFDYMEQKRKQVSRIRKNKFDLGDFVRIPLNFKKAIIDPEKVIAPTATPIDISIKLASLILPTTPKLKASGFRKAAIATKTAANPTKL